MTAYPTCQSLAAYPPTKVWQPTPPAKVWQPTPPNTRQPHDLRMIPRQPAPGENTNRMKELPNHQKKVEHKTKPNQAQPDKNEDILTLENTYQKPMPMENEEKPLESPPTENKRKNVD